MQKGVNNIRKTKTLAVTIALTAPLWLASIAEASYGTGAFKH